MPDNSVTVVGNLTQDPELRFTPSGVAMARISVAVNRRWMNRNTNEWEEEASFFSGTCWQEMAENVSESLQKGSRVIINGRLQQRSWETQEGERRSVVEIRIDEIGPSLRWATASVTRTPRRGGDNWGGGGRPAARPPGPVARETYGPDEAPF
ncbi:MAG: single-stranded DNA-binding protein [bacterium]|nr:single-stranded DNA-binding protein [bacterium]MDE0289287.1 single-stranded DNA-binding protein [bacterium]MDE0439676.1 single-stranded DNA-binding protein [bacterium]